MELNHYRAIRLAMKKRVVPPDVVKDRARYMNFGSAVQLVAAEATDLGLIDKVKHVEHKTAAWLRSESKDGWRVSRQKSRH